MKQMRNISERHGFMTFPQFLDNNFVNKNKADIKYLEKDDFYRAANAIYAKALLRGIHRVGLETLFCQNKPKGEKNVVNVKSNAG